MLPRRGERRLLSYPWEKRRYNVLDVADDEIVATYDVVWSDSDSTRKSENTNAEESATNKKKISEIDSD